MAELLSAALFVRNQRALIARRRAAPFAGQFALPLCGVRDDEAAEDALRRHAREQFGLALEPGGEQFVETVYLAEGDAQYVANIFRAPLPDAPMRFNAEGDYDDARWLAAADLDAVAMPPDLRIPLAQILTEPAALHELDWQRMGAELAASGQAVPLAERDAAAAAQVVAADEGGAAPDNRAGWDAISKAYQEQFYGDRDPGRLKWSWGLFEDDLRVLDDLRGKHALVLGCGGGQDVVALARMGAIATGIDASAKQIAYARRYIERQGCANASVAEGDVTDLSRFDDERFDAVISIHVLGYVEHAEAAIAEAARVLKTGGVLAIAVEHPVHHVRDTAAPYPIVRPYWARSGDWRWTFDDATSAPFRAYHRTMQDWFEMLTDSGLALERLIEPKQDGVAGDDAAGLDLQLARLQPYVLILKARKR